jgi:prepilin-type N-terminal cleavage/methylation domain-containing protein
MSHARPSSRTHLLAPRGGFTLIELLTVMIVVGVLIGLSLGMVRAAKQRAAIARARAELASLAQVLERYKSHYGDYPQTGGAGQAAAAVSAVVTQSQAQALLLNALIGVYGPTNFATRLNGPMLLEISKFRLEVDLTQATAQTFGVAQGTPPIKQAVANALLDPWGYRYQYYYKPAPVAGPPPTNQWRAPAYILYSVGPDGQHTPPNNTTGLFTGTAQTTGTNADNIYATP